MSLTVKEITFGTPEHEQMLDLRNRVLRIPIGLQISKEEIDADKNDYLIGAFDGNFLAGCLVLKKLDLDWVKIRQVAVDPDVQSRGTGAALLQASYDVARAWGYKKICCHAREPAIRFYLKNNWVEVGEMFDEQGIPHRRMEKELS